MSHAPDTNPRHFSTMTQLDHNRAASLLLHKCDRIINDIHHLAVWGSIHQPNI